MRITLNTIGIVCELNPLHNGHKYIIDKAKEKFGADFVVLVMSGDYTQRGTPSIVSKEIRTKMALMAGADAVFELPVQYATGSAEYFASGAVSLLNSLGVVDHILFGTENGDMDEIKNIASILNNEPEDYKKALQEGMKKGLNFASARDKALKQVISIDNKETLVGSNNILGIEYCRALMASGSKITPLTIKREGADYNEEEMADNFSSASAIRIVLEGRVRNNTNGLSSRESSITSKSENTLTNSITDKNANTCTTTVKDTNTIQKPIDISANSSISAIRESLSNNIPEDVLEVLLAEKNYNCLDNFSDYLHYKLLSERDKGFTNYADIHRDLSDKIIKNLPNYTTISEFIQLLKSKDLTYTRIQRSLLHILLGITNEKMELLKENDYPTYIRLLGFRKDSSPLLAKIKDEATAPVISRMSDSFRIEDTILKELLEEDVLASDIYHLIIPETKNEYQKPVIIL